MTDLFNGTFYNGKNLPNPRNTRFGYKNELSTVTASSSVAGFDVSALATSFTYDIWKPSTFPATITVDLGSFKPVDYIGFGAHEFAGCKVVVEYSDDGVLYTELLSAILTDNNAAMLLFSEVTTRYVRATLTGWAGVETLVCDFQSQTYSEAENVSTDTGGASCSVVYVGKALTMPQPNEYAGNQPGVLNSRSTYVSNDSEGGQWLGRSKVRRSFATSFSFSNMEPSWFRLNVQPFVLSVTDNPFFVSPRPEDQANECLYAKTTNDLEPTNSGVNNFMSLDFNVVGHQGNV